MPTQTITFATTSNGKITEASRILGLKIEPCGLDISEIQSLDPVKVATQKARDYHVQLKNPILVEDVALTFTALNGLPGTYINDFSKALDNDGLIALLDNHSDRSAIAQTTLVFVDEFGQEHVFTGKMAGQIAKEPLGTNGFGWDPIFIPDGQDLTLAQMTNEQKDRYSMRAKALKAFREWLDKNHANADARK